MDLTKREKTLVVGGILFLAILLGLQFVVRPAMEQVTTLRRVVADKRETLIRLRAMSVEYEKLEGEVSRLRSMIERQDQGPGILTTVERLRETAGLSENALSLKPTTVTMDDGYQETVVEIRLEGITLAQLVRFLSQLESLELAGGIKSLEVRHADRSPGSLRAVVQLATVSPGRTVSR